MFRCFRFLSFAAVLAVSCPAHAYVLQVLSPGTMFPPSQFAPVATFDGIAQTPYGSTTATGPFSDGGAAFSGSGVVMNNGGGDSLGLYATPFGDTTNYMAVLGGGSETVAYSSLMNTFGLYWGSVDSYNTLTFYDGATVVATLSGSDVQPALAANGGQTSYASNGYVLLEGLPWFNSVVIGSDSNSFEFDNVAAGVVPEASTWAMLGMGFLGLGFVAAARRRKDRLAPALG
jgi:hypothetical protein